MGSVSTRSLFSQILSVISRRDFERHVGDLQAEKAAKGFSCWDQFVAMLFCQLAQAKSLREICDGLRCCLGKLNHLGVQEAPKRSTLSYANAHRPWRLYEAMFYEVLASCRAVAPGKPFRFKNPLYSLDATVIDLCVTMFDWAKYVRTKGAIKLHLLLDHDGYLPAYAYLTEGKVHDIRVARILELPAGSIVAMDRGYHDFALFLKWTQAEIELLTNHLDFGASTISAIYRARWQIEQFFKALKQNLKVKTFVGVNANAVHIQIWTALIAMLLLRYLAFKSHLKWALSNLVALLRWNLFSYRNLLGVDQQPL